MLSLMIPSAVSLFPVTPAVAPVVTYLKEDKARGLAVEDQNFTPAGDTKLQPVIEVFEAQPFRISTDGDGEHLSQDFNAVIVISRGVPRPTEVRTFVVARVAVLGSCADVKGKRPFETIRK